MTNSDEFTPEERAQIREMLPEIPNMLGERRRKRLEQAQAEATRLTKELQGKYGGSS